LKKYLKKVVLGYCGGRKRFYICTRFGKTMGGDEGASGPKKVLKKLVRELEERKKRLPLQPGSEETGKD
jgi:hypothetical protein